jgi:hypothetical protein
LKCRVSDAIILTMKIIIALVQFLGLSFSASALGSVPFNNSLKTFETDGCTLFVDGTPRKPHLWKHCCVEHDMRYWFGGEQRDLDKTDLRLKACVQEVAGSAWAKLIYTGVRTGHKSPVKNKTHWSWGWNTERPNTIFSDLEIKYITEEIRRLPYDSEILENFIERNFNKPNVEI